MKIAIIGCGNLGSSIATGLANRKEELDLHIVGADTLVALNQIAALGIDATRSNIEAATDADIIFLCVKPRIAPSVLDELKDMLHEDQVIVSPVAGLTIEQIHERIGCSVSVFRIMPNIAAAINRSTTCVAYECTNDHIEPTMQVLRSIGTVIAVDEEHIGAATILTGSGIAYALRFMRAMTEGGIDIGFRSDVASAIVAETIRGTVELYQQGGAHAEQLIDRVCTPSGTTIRGLNTMELHGFSAAVIEGIRSSYQVIAH